ncbi:FAD:protein FMN transferase [Streptococcus suis]|nr:FAD:protein FMN transferase [Streptococcus suis]
MPITTHSLRLMGTKIDLLIDSARPEPLIDDCVALLHQYNKRFSANDDTSELMAINQNAGIKPVKAHPELLNLIALAKTHSLDSPSQLNIAIGPLVNAWRIGFSDAHVPDDAVIQEALHLTNPRDIRLDLKNQTVFLTKKGMRLDLGAVAKGYIADLIMAYLKSQSVSAAMINLGGNVLVYGPNRNRPDHKWYIGIQNPELKRGQNIGIVKITNQSVVTSGIYERKLSHNGKTYHHLLSPKTGYPMDTDMLSLTIVSDLSVDCELWTTRLFGLSVLEAMMMIDKTPHIEGIIITADHRIVLSEGLKEAFQRVY